MKDPAIHPLVWKKEDIFITSGKDVLPTLASKILWTVIQAINSSFAAFFTTKSFQEDIIFVSIYSESEFLIEFQRNKWVSNTCSWNFLQLNPNDTKIMHFT